MCPIFDSSPLHQFSKSNDFIYLQLIFRKDLSIFVSPDLKFHNQPVLPFGDPRNFGSSDTTNELNQRNCCILSINLMPGPQNAKTVLSVNFLCQKKGQVVVRAYQDTISIIDWLYEWMNIWMDELSEYLHQSEHQCFQNICHLLTESKVIEAFMKHKWIPGIGILLPKLFWLTVRKNCSSDQKKRWKFEAEDREFLKILRSNSERSE